MFNVITKLLKNIKSDKPLKYSLYINKNGITLIQNKYYTGVSHYELYGTHKKPEKYCNCGKGYCGYEF
jgi:hypothetical protein|tara:strand:+ start:241 stop:444 length:204 start_codon:yes stop_codon:yes gene_type:complete